jgi:hypothetical protein
MSVTVAELVRNGTMNAEMAALMWSAVDAQLSFLSVALPRLAGKTTTANAILALRPPGMPVHEVAGERDEMDRLQRERLGGYITVAEFSRAPMYGYIWGEPVQRVFDTLPYGYALQTSLHAQTVDEAMQVVTRGNGISDDQASAIKLVMYIERFGTDPDNFWRRVVDLFEVDHVEAGRPIGRSLFHWNQGSDSFEQVAQPRQFGTNAEDIARRASFITELVSKNKTGDQDVATALAEFRAAKTA